MDYPQLLKSGAIRQRIRVEGEDGTVGDAVVDLDPGEAGHREAKLQWDRGTELGFNNGEAVELEPLS